LIEKQYLNGFSAFNVSTLDALSVNEIADMTIQALGLQSVKRIYSGGNRGWKGDVPVVRLNSDKIRKLGWSPRFTSKEAMWHAIQSIKTDVIQHSL
jgi:UDP-glucose 4-epimerase